MILLRLWPYILTYLLAYLLKTSWVRSFPFPSFSCLPPSSFSFFLYFHIFSLLRLRNWAALKLVSGSGRSLAAKRHLKNFGLKECFW